MKYVLTWWERPGGSYAEYEAAQKRVLDVFGAWKMPETLVFHQFVVRLGEFGGYAVIETDDPAALHRLTTALAVFAFKVEPVMDVMDAVAAEGEAIAWRDTLGSP
jgi:muconolactone delta-isomerase